MWLSVVGRRHLRGRLLSFAVSFVFRVVSLSAVGQLFGPTTLGVWGFGGVALLNQWFRDVACIIAFVLSSFIVVAFAFRAFIGLACRTGVFGGL